MIWSIWNGKQARLSIQCPRQLEHSVLQPAKLAIVQLLSALLVYDISYLLPRYSANPSRTQLRIVNSSVYMVTANMVAERKTC